MFRHPVWGALALLVVLVAMLTWPQALHLRTHVASHDDALFSIWRLSWIAHALTGDIRHLFDGNIFYPHTGTLAYSDATLLEGILAAPWLAAHGNQVLVYNLVLLAGIVSSGIGAFVLVRYLTANDDAALVAAVIFTLAPYRIEHFMHLELQWTVWMPLAFWAIHRVFDTGSVRFALLAGILLWLQLISCVYYGVFLGIMVSALVVMLAVGRPQRAARAIRVLCIGAILPALLSLVYAQPYLANARVLGVRSLGDVQTFSAHLISYATAPEQNWLWGWTSDRFGGNELHLFPGIAAVVLALVGFVHQPRRLAWVYAALVALAVTMSLGLNGPIYGWLYAHVPFLGGFRAPARFAILACCAMAVLAGFGFDMLQRRVPAGGLVRKGLLVATLAMIGIECGASPINLMAVPPPAADVYRVMQKVSPSVTVEFPIVEWDLTAWVMYYSTQHWNPLVNGYSGFQPPSYGRTLERLRTFPDDQAMARLRELKVRYILVHEFYYEAADRARLLVKLAQRSDLIPNGRYRGPVGMVQVFEMRR
jgi:hypothetical protein